MSTVSREALWEVLRSSNCYLVKRRENGGAQFSRDPLNLLNKHSYKYDGLSANKAIGIAPHKDGGVTLLQKTRKTNKPASNIAKATWGKSKPERITYRGIVTRTAKQGYRPDLRRAAVARASAIRLSQRPKKDLPEKKLRGSKARKAAQNKTS